MLRKIALGIVVMLSALEAEAQDKPLPDVDSFIREARKKLRSDRLLLSQYTFIETSTEKSLDGKGRVKKTEVEVKEVYPSLEEGFTYERLISKDGKPVPPEDLARQDREHDKKMTERAAKLEREKVTEREKRRVKEIEERRKEDEAIDEALHLYDLSVTGRETLEGESAIRIDFRPRRSFQTKTPQGKILKKFSGRAWFSEAEHELIRIEAEVIDTISFGLGVLARLNKGARVEFQRRKINGEIWLPASAHFTGSARLLLLKGFHIDATAEYSGYKKFTVETSVSFPPDKPPE